MPCSVPCSPTQTRNSQKSASWLKGSRSPDALRAALAQRSEQLAMAEQRAEKAERQLHRLRGALVQLRAAVDVQVGEHCGGS